MRVVIAGAGLIGAAVAYRLARAGAEVTVVDGNGPASGASGHSFGWINASFFADEAHFRLRCDAIAAYHRLAQDLPGLPVTWPGCLWWEEQGEALDQMRDTLLGLGYAVEELDRARVGAAEPALADPPERALRFPQEGVADAAMLARHLLRAAAGHGARIIIGTPATGIATEGGRVSGLVTEHGTIAADRVVVAAGTGSPGLVAPLGVTLPLLPRPGLLMHTQPTDLRLTHVLVAPDQEVRQLGDGRLLAPTVAGHQSDTRDRVDTRPDQLAETALARLQTMFGEDRLMLEQVALAYRPVPQDGLPVIGAAGPDGLYLTVMHSGVTLAALVGELAAAEVLGREGSNVLAPYRPSRFQPMA